MNSALAVFLAGTVAFFLVLLVLAVISLFLRRRKHRSATHTAARAIPPPPLSSFPEECKSFDPSLPTLSVPLLTSATRDFHKDMVVGDGSFGLVYKALLPDGTCLAVKRLSPDYASHGLREFRAEVETLGQLHHPNLCRFLGYCSSGPLVRLLVYEFLPLGSLDVWLHESPPSPPLPFPTRLHAVRGVASGLAFLHHSCSPPVIHRDIKSSNVLLADDFSARIADFGLARFLDLFRSHVSTQVAGTMGYMPPEYRDGSTFATTKADVYSFGVLMLEVLSGRRPNLPVACEDSGRIRKNMAMVSWARKMAEEEKEMRLVEEGLEAADEAVVRAYVTLAIACISEVPKLRPSMEKVVELLEELSGDAV